MTKTVDHASIEETLSALADQPHDNCLSRVNFAELSQIEPISNIIKDAILGRTPVADDDEQEVRAELVYEQIKFIALRVKSISDYYANAPALGIIPPTRLMRTQIDEVSASLVQEFAIFGAMAFASALATRNDTKQATMG